MGAEDGRGRWLIKGIRCRIDSYLQLYYVIIHISHVIPTSDAGGQNGI